MSGHFSQVIDKLSEAVRFKTVSHVELEDINEAEFRGFMDFLHRSFPGLFHNAEVELIDRLGLLFYLPPSGEGAADPVMLLAHYDVVPVDNEEDWRYPPFSGAVEENAVWGRGTLDNKGALITLLEAADRLLREGWRPRRGIYFFAGHDEEVGGNNGARAVAELLQERGVRLSFVLDEGLNIVSRGIFPLVSGPLALIGISEKGHMDLRLTARGRSGYSSAPPASTAAGTLSRAVARVEHLRFPLRMTPPVERLLTGISPHVKGLKRFVLAHPRMFRHVLLHLLASSPRSNALVRTTKAVTMLTGSVKPNVLPEKAQAVVNCRIIPGQTMKEVLNKVDKACRPFGVTVERILELQANDPLPVADPQAEGFLMISRAINSIYPEAAVSPGLVMGTTDSRYFNPLTDNIYRFVPLLLDSALLETIHGVNERVTVDTVLKAVAAYEAMLQQL